MPYLVACEVVIHEEALYQVYVPLPYRRGMLMAVKDRLSELYSYCHLEDASPSILFMVYICSQVKRRTSAGRPVGAVVVQQHCSNVANIPGGSLD